MSSPWLCLPKRHNVLACVFDKKMFLVQQLHLPHTQPTNLNRIQVWTSAEYQRFYIKTALWRIQSVQVQNQILPNKQKIEEEKMKKNPKTISTAHQLWITFTLLSVYLITNPGGQSKHEEWWVNDVFSLSVNKIRTNRLLVQNVHCP